MFGEEDFIDGHIAMAMGVLGMAAEIKLVDSGGDRVPTEGVADNGHLVVDAVEAAKHQIFGLIEVTVAGVAEIFGHHDGHSLDSDAVGAVMLFGFVIVVIKPTCNTIGT